MFVFLFHALGLLVGLTGGFGGQLFQLRLALEGEDPHEKAGNHQ